ncbi:lipoate--protein ligase [Puteibacter caeruleilacunae]|nr:lipoate--protein ligase [Puteibacter caeruleilacunae]
MRLILLKSNDPYFNLAAEEYYMKSQKDDIFLLYINNPCLVIGKHQNTVREINTRFVKNNEIDVVRRLSGGGTVYHDLGNVNFSFHQSVEDVARLNYKVFLEPMRQVVESLGVKVTFSKRNDLLIDEKKISGNAEHVFKRRVLCHGTLLFDSDLDNLEQAIQVNEDGLTDKAVRSVRSKVTNILPHLPVKMSVVEFRDFIIQFFQKNHQAVVYEPTIEDTQEIEELVQQKYRTWEWNYGYSPGFVIKRTLRLDDEKIVEVDLRIKKGVIQKAEVMNISQIEINTKQLENHLIGCRHTELDISNAFKAVGLGRQSGKETTELVEQLF